MNSAKELLAEARQLISAARTNETRQRTVIGRAYYASFHAVLEKAAASGYRYQKNASTLGRHEHLIAWCLAASNADLRLAAEMLKGMKILRQRADYDLRSTVDYSDVVTVLEDASSIVEELL